MTNQGLNSNEMKLFMELCIKANMEQLSFMREEIYTHRENRMVGK